MFCPRKAGFGILILGAALSLRPVVTAPRVVSEGHRRPSQKSGQSSNSASSPSSNALDFDFFKSMVEPIFLKERPGHARCYGCHSESSRIFHLEKLSAGSAAWTEEQSWQNFQTVSRLVIPGNPYMSLLLIHPLAAEAGGDAFHSGGRQFETQNDPDWLTLVEWVRRTHSPVDPKTRSAALVYVTNSAGNTIDVVDPTTNTVVQVISGIELPHGVNFSPDGARVYISNESESVLDLVNRENGEILKRIPLSGHPNNIAVTRDGRRVLVGIRSAPGAVDVVDTSSLTLARTIAIQRTIHNVYVTPDGRFGVAGSIEFKSATIIDLQTDQVAWEIKFDNGVRPMAFETNPDGSTRRIFVQLSDLNGFAVVDFAKHSEVARIRFPDQPGASGADQVRFNTPSHGIGVSPDGKSLWIASTVANAVFKYSLPDLTLAGHCSLPKVYPPNRAPTGSVPEWITFTPDSKFVYVSNSGARSVSAIDARTLQIVAIIPAGEVPKRINTLVLR